MDGMGILKGLGVTMWHFVETYIEDLKGLGKRYYTPEGIARRSSADAKGIFTVQYPEEKLPVPEEFRYIPFLVYELGQNDEKIFRCTSCGICSKVCPPQCIWITRAIDPVTGRSILDPAEYYIDIDICMSCGMCAEYCPFDAIKMDHDYEIMSYERVGHHIFDKEKLAKPESYYAQIHPINFAIEDAARKEKEAAKAARKAA